MLRYGWFYGPGTYYASDGSIAEQVRKRRFPVVGKGSGVVSFLHVEDAAGATVVASERGAPGVYNVVDDEPAPFAEWLPVYAEALGAKRPRRVPAVHRPAGGGSRRRGPGDRAPRRLERQGEAGAGLAASLSELAPGVSRGAWIGCAASRTTAPQGTYRRQKES